MKIPILATGLSGMVGTRVQELLSDIYDFEDLSLATNVDITDYDTVFEKVDKSKAQVLIHLAAKTDVDSCEDDKILMDEGTAWLVNVEGTRNIVDAAGKTGKRVIFISTDFVFDGSKDFYREDDTASPVNWYGYTKFEGEKLVLAEESGNTVIRIAYPYRSDFSEKKDFVRRVLQEIQKGEVVSAVTDHIFTPTFIDDIVYAFKLFLDKQLPGIYHVVGGDSLSAYRGVKMIIETFGIKYPVNKTTRAEFFRDRAYRPLNLTLKNDRISELGIRMRTFREGLIEMKRQMGL